MAPPRHRQICEGFLTVPPDGKSALMLAAARLKYDADSEWGPAATWTCRFSKSSRANG